MSAAASLSKATGLKADDSPSLAIHIGAVMAEEWWRAGTVESKKWSFLARIDMTGRRFDSALFYREEPRGGHDFV